jgi:hypothetical protein
MVSRKTTNNIRKGASKSAFPSTSYDEVIAEFAEHGMHITGQFGTKVKFLTKSHFNYCSFQFAEKRLLEQLEALWLETRQQLVQNANTMVESLPPFVLDLCKHL